MNDWGSGFMNNSDEFTALGIKEFLNLEIPPREHILAPWLPVQGLAMIYAPRGIGKTYVALSIAHCVATGGKFLKWSSPVPRNVLYIDGEMPASLMQERIASIIGNQDGSFNERFRLLTPDLQKGSVPDLANTFHQNILEPLLADVDLIIVDNISTLCRSTKENDADTWGPVQDWALRMRSWNRSVLFIHHAGKGGNQRGTSKREDILDTVIALQHCEDHDPKNGAAFEVHFKKARGFCGEAAEPFFAKLSTSAEGIVHWEMDGVKASHYDQVIGMVKQGRKQNEIAEMLSIHKSNVSRYVQRAKEEGKLRSCIA